MTNQNNTTTKIKKKGKQNNKSIAFFIPLAFHLMWQLRLQINQHIHTQKMRNKQKKKSKRNQQKQNKTNTLSLVHS